MIKNSILFLLLAATCSCTHQKDIWPAYVTSYHNFTGEEITEIKKHLSHLNLMAKKDHGVKTLISFDKIDGNFEIIIKFNNEDGQEYPRVAGTALRKSRECIITIYPVTFERNMLKSVLWHEIGHCANLKHFKKENDIMYKSAKAFEQYDEYTVKRFVKRLNNKIWSRMY